MAIKLELKKTERILFCGSKWWGDPDMPENMQYPTMEVTEEGETFDYPLTFVCQINCEDIAQFDIDGKLPHEGMLYFFAAVDDYIGYESPVQNPEGEWPKGRLVIKYAKTINFETFQTCMMTGEEGESLTEPELEVCFEQCDDSADGIKLLGLSSNEAVLEKYPEMLNLLQLDNEKALDLNFGEGSVLNLLIKESDLKFGNWKRALAHLA